MKKTVQIIVYLIFCLGIAVSPSFAEDVKLPSAAGSFYPDNAQELSDKIDSLIAKANPEQMPGEIFALISPHAGYDFSGGVAAYGYKLIKGKSYKTVVVIGPSHFFGFYGISVYPKGVFYTPLGAVGIDEEFTAQLIGKDKDVFFEPQAFTKEHSLEVEIPFLQKILKENSWKLVPVIMGDCSLVECKRFAELLKDTIGSRKDVLTVASSDMYHGYDYDEAEAVDNLTLSYLKNMDAEGLYKGLREGKLQLCGGLPVTTTLLLAKEMGHNTIKLLAHTNSAKVTKNKIKGIWTVGYCSMAIDNPELNKEQRKKLLQIARSSIEHYLLRGEKIKLEEKNPSLLVQSGAFVTLNKHGQLRGCIGSLKGNQPLYLTIRDMAIEAAVNDWRFSKVELSELKDIEIEISVLSPLKRISSPDQIMLGVHGVLIKSGFNTGVFLPQVATETGWSKERFLSELCSQKAGLSSDAWKNPSTELYIFTAEVFSEAN
ncbi:MAG: AmmeMemoRadiSam system protein B [Candidatus Omnitrophota bacterium]|jgi:AmmeMemoRadiSam system protein B/AmmeMemoRadiSam system protein A